MLMKEISIRQADGYITILRPYYTNHTCSKGSILVLHGMAEHYSRYIEFAEFLNHCGFDVFLYDHRGHGTDKKLEELGFFDEKDGNLKVIGDALNILRFIKKNGRSEHVILFGHSMGSLIARNVIQYDDQLDCVILCGTNHASRVQTEAGLLLSSVIQKFKGPRYLSTFMNNLMFGSKYYKRINERTAYDWLSRNHNIVGQYIHDPYCGFLCTISMYRDILKFVDYATSPSAIRRTRRNLPIYIISGENDPVGSCGADIFRFVALLQQLGFTAVDCTIYKECRHELLNELNNKEVMKNIVQWINKIHEKPMSGNTNFPDSSDISNISDRLHDTPGDVSTAAEASNNEHE